MNPIVIVPARMAARRLPGKPLADIGGVAMIIRVMRCALAEGIGPVVVAAGDPEIVEVVKAAGGQAILTDPDLASGSDRILAALAEVDPQGRHDVVINLQGDMPFAPPGLLRVCTGLLQSEDDCDIATLVAAESGSEDRSNPDVVKAVLAMDPAGDFGRALYFTRSTLFGEGPIWRHIGLYAYRRQALMKFHTAATSPLERREGLEQLRALELGLLIRAAVVASAPISVDTPADLAAARAFADSQKGEDR